MATSTVSRLAPANARDGVDTRKQDNWGTAAAVNQETTSMGATHVTGGQQAAVEEKECTCAQPVYLAPPGVEVKGSPMSAIWSNYLRTAEVYIKRVHPDFFKFNSFERQQEFNERDIERETRKYGLGEEMLNVYRQCYNAEITTYLAQLNDPSVPEECRQLTLDFAMSQLENYKEELASQSTAAALIQQFYRSAHQSKVAAPVPPTYWATRQAAYVEHGPRT